MVTAITTTYDFNTAYAAVFPVVSEARRRNNPPPSETEVLLKLSFYAGLARFANDHSRSFNYLLVAQLIERIPPDPRYARKSGKFAMHWYRLTDAGRAFYADMQRKQARERLDRVDVRDTITPRISAKPLADDPIVRDEWNNEWLNAIDRQDAARAEVNAARDREYLEALADQRAVASAGVPF